MMSLFGLINRGLGPMGSFSLGLIATAMRRSATVAVCGMLTVALVGYVSCSKSHLATPSLSGVVIEWNERSRYTKVTEIIRSGLGTLSHETWRQNICSNAEYLLRRSKADLDFGRITLSQPYARPLRLQILPESQRLDSVVGRSRLNPVVGKTSGI